MNTLIDKSAIQDLINRFANCFDLKDWQRMESCLCASLHTDYSDLRGTPPEVISNQRFVELRRAALDTMSTQHLMSNHEIEIDGDAASATVSCVIFRKNPAGERLNTHCLYFFRMEKVESAWKISAIRQKVLLSEGNTAIHTGIVHK